MTTTKLIYLGAAILPMGFVLLAVLILVGKLLARQQHVRGVTPSRIG